MGQSEEREEEAEGGEGAQLFLAGFWLEEGAEEAGEGPVLGLQEREELLGEEERNPLFIPLNIWSLLPLGLCAAPGREGEGVGSAERDGDFFPLRGGTEDFCVTTEEEEDEVDVEEGEGATSICGVSVTVMQPLLILIIAPPSVVARGRREVSLVFLITNSTSFTGGQIP
jgi:hypothetical protein